MTNPGPRTGTAFGPYELHDLIGRGGMGEVYQAFDRRRNRTVALKLLPPSLAEDSVYRARFKREAQTAAQLTEPHVIPIHDFGELDGVLYIDMRLADGFRSLADRIEGQPLSPSVAVALVQQIGAALDAAHAQGLVHRDVKPANILVNTDDFAYLIDFGIARTAESTRVTEMGSTVGSLPYMAPERFSRNYQDSPAADVYSLACVLAECLTGRPVFAGTPEVILREHLDDTPPLDPRAVPAQLIPVLQRGLARDPAERPESTGEFARMAVAALDGGDRAAATTIIAKTNPAQAAPPTARPGVHTAPTTAAPEHRSSTSNRTRWIAVAVAAVVVLGGGGLLLRSLTDDSGAAAGVQPPSTTSAGAPPAVTANSTTTTGSTSTSASSTDPAVDDGGMHCVGKDGADVGCTDPLSGYVVQDTTCTAESVQRSTSYDDQLVPLLRYVKGQDGSCEVFPTAAAAAQGASGYDVFALFQVGSPTAALLSCQAEPQDADPIIPCSEPHRVELIGRWLKLSGSPNANGVCQTAGGRYTLRDALQLTPYPVRLVPGTHDGSTQYRCAVVAPKTISDTVYHKA